MPVLFATAYFPAAWYMAEAIRADEIEIEAFEHYAKQTCRNHCTIFGPNGRQTLSIPVIKTNGNHTLIKDVLISDRQPWQKTHWRSIETAYNNSPFFLYYQDNFSLFFEKRHKYLLDLNTEILTTLLKVFRSNRPVRFTENYHKHLPSATDLRAATGAKDTGVHGLNPHYPQVFEPRHGFLPGLSIMDVIFNLGPETFSYLDAIG